MTFRIANAIAIFQNKSAIAFASTQSLKSTLSEIKSFATIPIPYGIANAMIEICSKTTWLANASTLMQLAISKHPSNAHNALRLNIQLLIPLMNQLNKFLYVSQLNIRTLLLLPNELLFSATIVTIQKNKPIEEAIPTPFSCMEPLTTSL